jgi:hypothetical protein
VKRFAGVSRSDYEFFVERVDLRSSGAANRAIDRWRRLERDGWDVMALGHVDGSHMIGLGCRYLVELRDTG